VIALFEQHDIHRVFAEAQDRNRPVHRLLELLHFRFEGRLLEADWFKRRVVHVADLRFNWWIACSITTQG
jgi:RimJ/RimL family protein N-acetyltransferase